MKRSILFLSLVLAAGLSGCKREAPAATAAKVSKPPSSKPSGGAISRIVFVDKEKCCDCTRKRIDSSWKALTDVVGFPPVPDVERIHMDSQADKAEIYKRQRPIMVPPAIYFFDKQGKLVHFLQGEVTSAQIKKALAG